MCAKTRSSGIVICFKQEVCLRFMGDRVVWAWPGWRRAQSVGNVFMPIDAGWGGLGEVFARMLSWPQRSRETGAMTLIFRRHVDLAELDGAVNTRNDVIRFELRWRQAEHRCKYARLERAAGLFEAKAKSKTDSLICCSGMP
jgi:hypothetical protein